MFKYCCYIFFLQKLDEIVKSSQIIITNAITAEPNLFATETDQFTNQSIPQASNDLSLQTSLPVTSTVKSFKVFFV